MIRIVVLGLGSDSDLVLVLVLFLVLDFQVAQAMEAENFSKKELVRLGKELEESKAQRVSGTRLERNFFAMLSSTSEFHTDRYIKEELQNICIRAYFSTFGAWCILLWLKGEANR